MKSGAICPTSWPISTGIWVGDDVGIGATVGCCVSVAVAGTKGVEVWRIADVSVAGASLPQPVNIRAAIDRHIARGCHLNLPVRVINPIFTRPFTMPVFGW